MNLKTITKDQKNIYNQRVSHIIQSWQWGEFRQKLGLPLERYGLFEEEKLAAAFEITFHKIPYFNQYIGYLPKGPLPDDNLSQALLKIAKDKDCAAIKIEPDIILDQNLNLAEIDQHFSKATKSLFTKYNFLLDLTQSEAAILKNMHPKSRYNIKVAQKHGVKVEERTDDQAFEIYLDLYFSTTARQKYHGHNKTYHRLVWQTLKQANMARLLIAFYTPPGAKKALPLTAWMLLNFKDTLYYPYGGSSDEYRNVMSSNLVAWEAIKLGKKMGLKTFDLWGALSPQPDPNHPWYGFHNFKDKLGAQMVENLGTFDLVLNKPLYQAFNLIDQSMGLKVFLLKLLGKS